MKGPSRKTVLSSGVDAPRRKAANLKKRIFGIGVFGATVTAFVVVGGGVAHAFPNVQGGLYSDVKKQLTSAGYSVKVAGRVGDRLADDKCVVAHAQEGSSLNGVGKSNGKIALIYLNCYADVASSVAPGYSAASTEGQAAISAREKAAAQKP